MTDSRRNGSPVRAGHQRSAKVRMWLTKIVRGQVSGFRQSSRQSFRVADRLRSELKLKLLLMVLLNLWVYVPYWFLQRHPLFQPTLMPASFLDRLIPFWDKSTWVYLSIYFLMPIGPFLMNDRREIARYSLGVVLMGALADLVFIFWPTYCARPDPAGTNALYRALVAFDHPLHAFPSLHAAFAVFSALCASQILREMRVGRIWRCGLWCWAVLILFATLATKQHVLYDILGGSLLAFGAHCLGMGRMGRMGMIGRSARRGTTPGYLLPTLRVGPTTNASYKKYDALI
ncbi:MAG: hypothetical protein C5B50_11505 [Verrucomicrobia bacterium]|nr:MAG: hypothetical protein C5B50_11505 [Verrucomicrobiota bacterium]